MLLPIKLQDHFIFWVPNGERSHNLLNHNQVLCQLSYRHHIICWLIWTRTRINRIKIYCVDHYTISQCFVANVRFERLFYIPNVVCLPLHYIRYFCGDGRHRTDDLLLFRETLLPSELHHHNKKFRTNFHRFGMFTFNFIIYLLTYITHR